MFEKKKMSDLEKKAKLAALGDANKMAKDALKGNLSGLKKVSVMSDSKEGLKKGLDKAEELVAGAESEEKEYEDCPVCGGEGCPACPSEKDSEESPDRFNPGDDTESEDMSEEELDAKIEELMKMKEQLQSGEE